MREAASAPRHSVVSSLNNHDDMMYYLSSNLIRASATAGLQCYHVMERSDLSVTKHQSRIKTRAFSVQSASLVLLVCPVCLYFFQQFVNLINIKAFLFQFMVIHALSSLKFTSPVYNSRSLS